LEERAAKYASIDSVNESEILVEFEKEQKIKKRQ